MITQEQKRILLENMTELLEIPESAYEKAAQRYEDLGEWFDRKDSIVKNNKPHILPQGSFRLGTAIRPLDEKEAFDLDLVCKLRDGINKSSHTQEALKKLVGHELELYRIKRGIKAQKEEKHRCWRLEYQDELNFHMDIVPCIPADESRQKLILEAIKNAGESEIVASSVSQLTVSITDDRHHGYRQICQDWNISNPEGYAKWFETRMNEVEQTILEKAKVDDVPLFKRKNPLQRSIQLLKRHRDHVFKSDQEVKPISIIITTLAARVYQGETDIEAALRNILSQMGNFVKSSRPRVPNPVDPGEDFADRWSMPEYKHLNLEQNFWNWLKQVGNDFDLIGSSEDVRFTTEQVQEKFSVNMNALDLGKRMGLAVPTVSVITPKSHLISEPPAKPWGIA